MIDDEDRYRIALAGTLPEENANGWMTMAEDLDEDREKVRYARVAYTVAKVSDVVATGRRIITVQLMRVEPVEGREAASSEEQMLAHLSEQRTGQASLFRGDPRDDDE